MLLGIKVRRYHAGRRPGFIGSSTWHKPIYILVIANAVDKWIELLELVAVEE